MTLKMLPTTTGAYNYLCIDDYTISPWFNNAKAGSTDATTMKDSGLEMEFYCDGARRIAVSGAALAIISLISMY